MKETMNKEQKNYIVSKVMWETVNMAQKEKFNEFLQIKCLTENDLNDDNFNTLCAEYDIFATTEIKNSVLAWENLKLAENALIEFGISIAPVSIQETIKNGVKRYAKNRSELIDIAFKIDVSTITQFKKDLAAAL